MTDDEIRRTFGDQRVLEISRRCLNPLCERKWLGIGVRPGSRCPFCGSDDTEVIDTRVR